MKQDDVFETELRTALDAGAAMAQPVTDIGCIPYVVIPEGYTLQDLDNLFPTPARKTADVTTTDTDSFIFYMKKHGRAETATIYADIDAEDSRFNLIGVLNDHAGEANGQNWRDHLCLFRPAKSVEWERWLGKNKQHFSQAEFATWLEDNLPDIASVEGMPSGADILQMALGFEANAEKRLRSKINLQNGGVQFEFVEDEEKETRTRMQVFRQFTLGLPVFEGSANAYPLEARLKYREREGRVTFWYELIRHDRVFKSAVSDELSRIKEGTGFPVVSGKPF